MLSLLRLLLADHLQKIRLGRIPPEMLAKERELQQPKLPREMVAKARQQQRQVAHSSLMNHARTGNAPGIEMWMRTTPQANRCLDCLDDGGMAALHVASGFGHVDTINMLLHLGAQATLLTTQGLTALHTAATHCRSVASIRRLVEAGCPIDARVTQNGFTALHMAAYQGHADCVQMLLDSGASTDLTVPESGKNARSLAASRGYDAVERVLTEFVNRAAPDAESATVGVKPPWLLPKLGATWWAFAVAAILLAIALVAILLRGARTIQPKAARKFSPRRRKKLRSDDDAQRDWTTTTRLLQESSRSDSRRSGAPAGTRAGGDCVVCLDDAQTHLLVPCGHLCLCAACSETLMSELCPLCPVCRTPCDTATRVFKVD